MKCQGSSAPAGSTKWRLSKNRTSTSAVSSSERLDQQHQHSIKGHSYLGFRIWLWVVFCGINFVLSGFGLRFMVRRFRRDVKLRATGAIFDPNEWTEKFEISSARYLFLFIQITLDTSSFSDRCRLECICSGLVFGDSGVKSELDKKSYSLTKTRTRSGKLSGHCSHGWKPEVGS